MLTRVEKLDIIEGLNLVIKSKKAYLDNEELKDHYEREIERLEKLKEKIRNS